MAIVSASDGYGRYLFEYRHDGCEWGIEIVAKSQQDARERLKAISWANYRGEIAAKIPVPGGGLLSRLFPGRFKVVWGGKKDQPRLPPHVLVHARRQLERAKASVEVLYGVKFH